ncbi:hypothetical protein GCM10022243_49930 [Saccharothrix violaceirubra]
MQIGARDDGGHGSLLWAGVECGTRGRDVVYNALAESTSRAATPAGRDQYQVDRPVAPGEERCGHERDAATPDAFRTPAPSPQDWFAHRYTGVP